MSFRWVMGDYVGGDTAVGEAYKPFLCLKTDSWAHGEFSVAARSMSDIVISGLGFQPDVIVLMCHRPRNHALQDDTSFGRRGGGMSFGVAGRSPAAQFTGSTRIQQGWDLGVGHRLWREDRCLSVVSRDATGAEGPVGPIEILSLTVGSWDAGGFTLSVEENLYDGPDTIAWLAMKGTFEVGVFDAGDTSVSSGIAPEGAMFLSVKALATDPIMMEQRWDHMIGFASEEAQNAIWGGARTTSWGWTTERWSDDYSIVLCEGAQGSGYFNATVLVEGAVTTWGPSGIGLQWYTFDNQPYRIGYVLCGDDAEAGVLTTNWETRPGGTQNDPPGSGYNVQDTVMSSPEVILMAATNYFFGGQTRIADAFGFGGSGGLGWHIAPFSESGLDAYGIHTYGNGVQEMGHYSNSSTQFMRRYILAGQGANVSPPAYHQHSVNVIPSPKIVGLNYRYAERHAQVKRLHVNQSDQYLP